LSDAKQLGGRLGLGFAESVTQLKARGVYGVGQLNQILVSLPRFWSIHKELQERATEDTNIQEIALTNGRIKKFSFVVINHTLTQDAEIQFRINGVDAGTAIPFPASTSIGALLETAMNINIEFVAGDLLNYVVRFTGGAGGQVVLAPSTLIEFDSDAKGSFKPNIYNLFSFDQSVAATRKYMNNGAVWVAIADDNVNHHILNNGKIISVSGYVATGFPTIRTHAVSSRIDSVSNSTINWLAAETGFKQTPTSVSFAKGAGLCLQLGQVGLTLEPMTGWIVFEMDEPT